MCIAFFSPYCPTITLKSNLFFSSSSECPPKWRLAVEVMAEIKVDYRARMQAHEERKLHQQRKAGLASVKGYPKSSSSSSSGGGNSSTNANEEEEEQRKRQKRQDYHFTATAGRVLFIVKDSLAQAQLRDVLVHGTAFVGDQRYRWFTSQQAAEIRGRAHQQHKQQQGRSGGGGGGNGGAKRGAPSGESGRNKFQRSTDDVTGGLTVNNSSTSLSSKQLQMSFLNPQDQELLGEPIVVAAPPAATAGFGNDGGNNEGLERGESGGEVGSDGDLLSLLDTAGMPSARHFQSLPEELKLTLLQVRACCKLLCAPG